ERIAGCYWMETPLLGEVVFLWVYTTALKPREGYYKVDDSDLLMASSAQGSQGVLYPNENWFTGADVAPRTGHVDIYDLATIASRYGQTWGEVPFGSPMTTKQTGNVQSSSIPGLPLLKVTPENITISEAHQNFTVDVWLLGENGSSLDPFWDIVGLDLQLNFNASQLIAIGAEIDPDGWFSSFYPEGILELEKELDNLGGSVQIAFTGIGDLHTPVTGIGRLFTVSFRVASAPSNYEPTQITLATPETYEGRYKFYSLDGLIDVQNPMDTQWQMLTPVYSVGPFLVTEWLDNNDSELNIGDYCVLNDTTSGLYHDYHIEKLIGVLNLTQQPFLTVDNILWSVTFPEDGLWNTGYPGTPIGTGTADPYNGFGNPYWTGNFSLSKPIESVDSIAVHALPFTADEYTYTLTDGVDYQVHPDDDLIELLTPVDVNITNEFWVDGVNNSLNGMPQINYLASGILDVYVDMNNGTARSSPNAGYAQDYTFGEWWYDPEWPQELEGWWALGYYPGPWNWPAGSEWWINYTAASYLTVSYYTDPNPELRYIEFTGSYDEFELMGDPTATLWTEGYPRSWRTYNLTGWLDVDDSGNLTSLDFINVQEEVGDRTYVVNTVMSGVDAERTRSVCTQEPQDPFYGIPVIVDVAGFPHPDRGVCPWHNCSSSVPLPHLIENAHVSFSDIHDLAISSTPPTQSTYGEGSIVEINFTICNQGSVLATSNITLYANGTEIQTRNITIGSLETQNMSFTWNTTGFLKGNYLMNVTVTPVIGETDIADNDLQTWILLTLPGDVDGDKDVDIFDIVLIVHVYGSQEGQPAYNPDCDFDADGDVDIFDVIIAASNYGKSW
ncbi:MAG: hypothetical protein JSV35_04860, partial [Candidatus Bathyarchaeota archaeon]